MKMLQRSCLILSALFLTITPLVFAQSVKSAHTEVEIVSAYNDIVPGRPLEVALRMKMEEGWHVYWKNPGDSGLPPAIRWQLPDGFTAGEILWPIPHRITVSGLTSYVYEGEVFLLTRIKTPDTITQSPVVIKAHVDWLACEKICIPGSAGLSLNLSVSDAVQTPGPWFSQIDAVKKNLPAGHHDWKAEAYADEQHLELYFYPPPGQPVDMTTIEFFPQRDDIIVHGAGQDFTKIKNGFALNIPRSAIFKDSIIAIDGLAVLTNRDGRKEGTQFHAMKMLSASKLSDSAAGPPSIWVACLFAFLGGMILNLMPCVLPVLSIKILSLIEHAQERSKALKHGLAYALGVLASFWLLAAVLIVLKYTGHAIGWGFQFQSPVFIGIISCVLLIFALNLFGVFEIVLNAQAPRASFEGYRNAFLSGVLATVVATPCTAPLMGTAIGYAVTQNAFTNLLIFSCLGLGMAFPFLVIVGFPVLLKFVPKPGIWMLHLKKFLGFLLLAAVVWLAGVFQLQAGPQALVSLLTGYLVISLGAWMWGLGQLTLSNDIRIKVLSILSFIIITIGIFLVLKDARLQSQTGLSSDASFSENKQRIAWKKYSPELIAQLRKERKPIFLDFTAAWCLSCQVNERIVFHNRKVIEKFKESGIVAVKADWTTWDKAITRALAGFGKNSIPLYVFYPPDPQKEAVILPEIITPDIVLKVLEKI